jgi:glycine/D-amino acid oxidase-like deaminating enzyme
MDTNKPRLPEATDVIIVGAGIAGISAAWFLNKAGLRVVVCEKGIVAGEQSSRNWGWIRQQGRDQAELPIVMESMRL